MAAEPSRWTRFVSAQVEGFDPLDSVESWFVPPWALFAFRGFFAAWTTMVFLFAVVLYRFDFYITAFTNLSWIGLSLYFWVSAINSFVYLRYGKPLAALRSRRGVQVFYLWAYACLCFHYVVSLVFWTILAKHLSIKTPLEIFMNANVHSADVLLVTAEALLSRITLRRGHAWMPLTVAVLFAGWAWVSYATIYGKEKFVYPFMDYHYGPIVIAYYVGIVALFVVAFALFLGLARLRNWQGKRRAARRPLDHGSQEHHLEMQGPGRDP